MGNSSIGTTPILLGLQQDLPRAEEELARWAAHPEPLTEILSQLEQLIVRARRGDDDRQLQMSYRDLAASVAQAVEKSAVLRYVAGPFAKPFRGAGRAAQVADSMRMADLLDAAAKAMRELIASLPERHAEIPRRKRAAELFLRLIAHGQMSAFALTEPTAGSDSGGVKTQARLTLRRLEPGPWSTWRYYLDAGARQNSRVLLDADRLVFTAGQIAYKASDSAEPAVLQFDEYDYAGDTVKTRYFVHAGERVEFHDIAQLRHDAQGPYWSYYELTGSKMWITNGRVAGVMCLYATTPEGVTGFMVDRHAEGLVVGADEDKLGQRGSPTNEISLQAVRVAAENVIGFPGRGQVNALETLNIGRGGLCVSAVGIGADVLHRLRNFLRGRATTYAYFQVGSIASELLAIQSIAYELIGLYDTKQAEAVRVESAIGKYWASEALHRMFGYEEDLRGLPSTTQRHDVEKKRRDARVINIYEGTNEIQRFLLLKDLTSYLADRYTQVGPIARSSEPVDAAGRVDCLKDRLFTELVAARSRRQDAVWASGAYQPTYFTFSELAGQLKIADSLLYRLAVAGDDSVYARGLRKAGELSCELILREAELCLARYQVATSYLDQELYPPEVQLGYLLLENGKQQLGSALEPTRTASAVGTIAVVVLPQPRVAPQPRLADGALAEPLWQLSAQDRQAVATAARLRTVTAAATRIVALGVGTALCRDAVRETLVLGADEAVWIETAPSLTTSDIASAVLDALERWAPGAELVLCGEAAELVPGTVGLAAYLAAALDTRVVTGAARLGLTTAEDGSLQLVAQHAAWCAELVVSLPAVASLAVVAGESPPTTMSRRLSVAGKRLAHHSMRAAREQLSIKYRTLAKATGTAPAVAREASSAARVALELLGASSGTATSYQGMLMPLGEQDGAREASVLALTDIARGLQLDSGSLVAVERASRLARAWSLPCDIVVPCATNEAGIRAVAGQLQSLAPRRIYLLSQGDLGKYSWRGLLALFEAFANQYAGTPQAIVGPTSLNDALAQLARRLRSQLLLGVDSIENGCHPPRLVASAFAGRAEAIMPVRVGAAAWVIGINPAKVALRGTASTAVEVYAESLACDYDYQTDPHARLVRAQEQPLTLSTADVIVDIGYALKSRADLEAIAYPLAALLRDELGQARTMIGATRKVTQDLKILPDELQIGQTGVRVAPRLLLALGVSGAPQHIDWIDRGTVIIAFNQDPAAPLMQWNREHALPVVHPIIGDLFVTVPAFIKAVREQAATSARP
jgi:alkylation response protein AidB-like acyl-CoA dehydrogenase/electron transfer flavoprotein alpha subunit